MKISICIASLVCLLILFCEAGKASPDWRTAFVPLDPWRAIGGQTNYVKLNGVQFCGKIVDVTPHGIRVEGDWGLLGTIYYPANGWDYLPLPPKYPEYFVTNYPYKAVTGGIIASAKRVMAWYAGTYTYKTAKGDSRTIGELDYGIPCGPNPAWVATMQKQIQEAKEKRREADLRKMEFLEMDATNGDSSAQYSLGFHYLHGIGCETNEVMGLFWLLKASAQGNLEASNDLQEFEFESTNRWRTLKR